MRSLVMAGAALAIGAAAQAQVGEPVQWRVEDGGNGHWYARSTIKSTWDSARAATQAVGGHLATIRDAGENEFIRSISTHVQWIGGRRAAGTCGSGCGWQWDNGEPWSFTNWRIGEPNGGVLEQTLDFYSDGTWNDDNGLTLAYIIEWSADCNGDGIVDYGQCRDGTLPDYDGDNVPDCCEAGTPCVVGNYPVQWDVEEGGNGHWYQLTPLEAPLNWDASASQANRSGGHLATPTTEAEDAFIRIRVLAETIPVNVFGPHIGGLRSDSPDTQSACTGWAWVTGEPFQYVQSAFSPNLCEVWQTYYPYEDRLHYWIGGTYAWNNCVADLHVGFLLVEWSADCNANGIVDFGEIRAGQLPDQNANNVPDGCECTAYPELDACCPGDLYRNGVVNGADLGILLSEWGEVTPTTTADLNRDGAVDGGDLGILLSNWGACPG